MTHPRFRPRDTSPRLVRAPSLAALALVALSTAACSAGAGPDVQGPAPTGDLEAGVAESADTVEVLLTEYVIDMPSTVSPGLTVFRIVNEGMEDHNFLVARDGVRSGIEDAIPPGDVEHLTVELEEGEFTALCTWASHDAKGMVERIEVARRAAVDDSGEAGR